MEDVLSVFGIDDEYLRKFISTTEYPDDAKQRGILYYIRLAYTQGYNDAVSKIKVVLPEKIDNQVF